MKLHMTEWLAVLAAIATGTKKSKNQIKREKSGWAPPAQPVAGRSTSDFEDAVQAQLRYNRRMNPGRPRHKKLCTNVKKLRTRTRQQIVRTEKHQQFC